MNEITSATSSGVPKRFRAQLSRKACRAASGACLMSLVSIKPGITTLQRMLNLANSLAATLVSASTPALDALVIWERRGKAKWLKR